MNRKSTNSNKDMPHFIRCEDGDMSVDEELLQSYLTVLPKYGLAARLGPVYTDICTVLATRENVEKLPMFIADMLEIVKHDEQLASWLPHNPSYTLP